MTSAWRAEHLGEHRPSRLVATAAEDRLTRFITAGISVMLAVQGRDRSWRRTFAFVPLPIAWLLAYALVYLVRWMRAGFTPRPN
jgi:hypothetical protein